MVAADDDRDDPLAVAVSHRGDLADELADGRHRPFGAEGIDRSVTVIDHRHLFEWVDQGQHVVHGESAPTDSAGGSPEGHGTPRSASSTPTHVGVAADNRDIHIAGH